MLSQRTRHIRVHNMHKLQITGHWTCKLNASPFLLFCHCLPLKLKSHFVILMSQYVFFFISNHWQRRNLGPFQTLKFSWAPLHSTLNWPIRMPVDSGNHRLPTVSPNIYHNLCIKFGIWWAQFSIWIKVLLKSKSPPIWKSGRAITNWNCYS